MKFHILKCSRNRVRVGKKKTGKFILITTLKAYINGDNFRAFSYLPWNSKSMWLDYSSTLRYRFRGIRGGVHTIGDFYRKIRGRITVASTVLHQWCENRPAIEAPFTILLQVINYLFITPFHSSFSMARGIAKSFTRYHWQI